MSDFSSAEGWEICPDQRWQHRWFLPRISYQRIGLVTAISDFVLILVASVDTGVAYHILAFHIDGAVQAFAFVGCYSGLTFVLLCNAQGLYRPQVLLSATTQTRGVVIAWGGVLAFVAFALFLLKIGADYSRGATICFGFAGLGLLLALRTTIGINFRQALANDTLDGQRAVIIGDTEELAAKSAGQLLRSYGAREVGRFELPPMDPDHSKIEHDMAIVDSGIRAARTKDAEYVLLALRWTDTWRRDLICERLRELPLPVLLLPDRSVSSILSQADWAFSAETPIEIQRAPLSREELFVKRIFDLIFAFLGLAVFILPAALICVAIMLTSPGPAIFRQRRRGFNGREFAIYKFRTMRVLEDGPTIQQARRNDPRVTTIGRLLRATSIDEVPQLINVLKGEMSLVGPRPHAVAHDDEYSNSIEKYAFRQHVKPGLTGWAQVNGFRGETIDVELMKKRIDLDLWYINNWGFRLDLRIVARTFIEVLRPRNAY
jgi:Undecaprenyl-phosphate glucose phosphotransferase